MRTNSVQLIGFVGQDLKEKSLSSGGKMVMLRVSTTHPQKDKEGNVTYPATWHDVVAWGEVAEYAGNNFVKGSKILVDGMIVYRTYPDQHGHTRYVTEIKATSLENLDR